MKKFTSNLSSIYNRESIVTKIMIVLVFATVAGCSKSGGSSSSTGGGNAPLLSKEIIIGTNGANVVVDSVVTQIQYNADKTLSETQQVFTSQYSGFSSTISLTYNFTYANNLVSNISGTYSQTQNVGGKTYSSSGPINISFVASGGRVVSYVQSTNITGNSPVPITTITGNDSALLVYDANGEVINYTIYQKELGSHSYSLLSKQSYTYSAGNLSGIVQIEFAGGTALETITSTYQYNSKISPSPLFIFPGVNISIINDISKLTRTTTGFKPSVNVATYQTTYNSSNQPTSSDITIVITPTVVGNLKGETISYYYQ